MSVIYQYQEPPLGSPAQGPSKKKLFFVIALTVFVVIVMVLVAVFGTKKTVKPSTTAANEAEVRKEVVIVVNTVMEKIKKNDTSSLKEMASPDSTIAKLGSSQNSIYTAQLSPYKTCVADSDSAQNVRINEVNGSKMASVGLSCDGKEGVIELRMDTNNQWKFYLLT